MKYSLFIGRWQVPNGLHEGHIKMIKQAKYVPLIAIRDTPIDKDNPYSADVRKKNIEKKGYRTIIIPDIAEVVYGRGVGWNIREIKLDKETEAISATKIRNDKKEMKKWK